MSESVSLAVLENLVHMSKEDFPVGYVSVSAVIPDDLSILTEDDLRKDFPDAELQELGDHWLASAPSAALRVRSAVVSQEFNFLLNPQHPDFARIIAETPMPFVFDDRLFS
jgi:RES domain-containing protein